MKLFLSSIYLRYILAALSFGLAIASYTTHYEISFKVILLIVIGFAYFLLGRYESKKPKVNKA